MVEIVASEGRLGAAEHVALLLQLLVTGVVVTWYCWGLNSSDLAPNSLPTVHHLIEHFLLARFSICLVLLTYRAAVPGVVPNTEKVGPRIITPIRLRVELVLILGGQAAWHALLRAHRMHSFDIDAWRLGWLSGNGTVLIRLPISLMSVPVFGLVTHIVIQQRHMLGKALLLLNVCVRPTVLLVRAHR